MLRTWSDILYIYITVYGATDLRIIDDRPSLKSRVDLERQSACCFHLHQFCNAKRNVRMVVVHLCIQPNVARSHKLYHSLLLSLLIVLSQISWHKQQHALSIWNYHTTTCANFESFTNFCLTFRPSHCSISLWRVSFGLLLLPICHCDCQTASSNEVPSLVETASLLMKCLPFEKRPSIRVPNPVEDIAWHILLCRPFNLSGLLLPGCYDTLYWEGP